MASAQAGGRRIYGLLHLHLPHMEILDCIMVRCSPCALQLLIMHPDDAQAYVCDKSTKLARNLRMVS